MYIKHNTIQGSLTFKQTKDGRWRPSDAGTADAVSLVNGSRETFISVIINTASARLRVYAFLVYVRIVSYLFY